MFFLGISFHITVTSTRRRQGLTLVQHSYMTSMELGGGGGDFQDFCPLLQFKDTNDDDDDVALYQHRKL
jgi:hypothetical protein